MTATRRVQVTPEIAAAIDEAAREGERLVLVSRDGRAIATAMPNTLPTELAKRFAIARAKKPDELTEEDEDTLDAVAAYEARDEWAADNWRTVPWDQVKASLRDSSNE